MSTVLETKVGTLDISMRPVREDFLVLQFVRYFNSVTCRTLFLLGTNLHILLIQHSEMFSSAQNINRLSNGILQLSLASIL